MLDLNIVPYSHALNRGSFLEVARRIETRAPDISVRVLKDRRYRLRKRTWTWRPSFTASILPLYRFQPRRGAVLTGRKLGKTEEMRRLEEAAFPVPRWRAIAPGEPPDLEDFGRYFVVKPERGCQGA